MERKLTAILCADVYGYSRLMGEDEEATLRTLSSHRKIIDGLIERHHGRFVNSAGDSVLAEFASVVEAVNCGVEIQRALKGENANLSPRRRMEFRVGVNLGDVMVDGEQIYGDGVNVAARLEGLADPGEICISGTVYEQVRDKLPFGYEDRGEQTVKNIARPVHVWRVLLDGMAAAPGETRRLRRRYWRGGVLSLTGLAIAVATFFIVQHLSLKPPRTPASVPSAEKPALALPSIPSIAVLPFTNLSGDPRQEYFSDGMTDQLINDLSTLPGLFVISRNSTFAYKGKAITDHEVGKALGVRYVLEGSVRKSSERMRIGVELVDASSGTDVWTQRFARPLKDIFAVQDEIVEKVVTTVGLLLKQEEVKVPHWNSRRPTENLEAYDAMLRASEYGSRFTKDDWLAARHWSEKAIALDPKSAEAYAALAGNYESGVLFRWSKNPEADLGHALELAQKALALDDSNSVALVVLCEIHWQQKRFDQAVAEGERAVAINPNFASGYVVLGEALDVANRVEEAMHAVEKAMRLDPTRPEFYEYFIAQGYVDMGRYQEAIPLLKRHLAVYPNQPWAHVALIEAYSELGREQEARVEAAELKRINPQFAYRDVNKDAARNVRYGMICVRRACSDYCLSLGQA
jgi:adenylate cyclase